MAGMWYAHCSHLTVRVGTEISEMNRDLGPEWAQWPTFPARRCFKCHIIEPGDARSDHLHPESAK